MENLTFLLFYAFLALSFKITSSNPIVNCTGEGWIPLDGSDNSGNGAAACFTIIVNASDFLSAKNYCENQNATLFTILQKADQNKLVESMQIKNVSSVWIGFNDVLSNEVFQWHSGYVTYWWNIWLKDASSQDRVNGLCIALNTSESSVAWFYYSCNFTMPAFACEKRPPPPPSATAAAPSSNNGSNALSSGVCQKNFFRVDNYCYLLVNVSQHGSSAVEAQQICARNYTNSTLATIPNQRVQDYFTSLMGLMLWDAWIGLNKVSELFEWANNASGTFSNWMYTEPNLLTQKEEICVLINNHVDNTAGQWKTARCSHPQPFICESPLRPVQNASSNTQSLSTWTANPLFQSHRLCNGPLNSSTELNFQYHSRCYYVDFNQTSATYTEAQQKCTKWRKKAIVAQLDSAHSFALMHHLLEVGNIINTTTNSIWLSLTASMDNGSGDITFNWSQSTEDNMDNYYYPEIHERVRLIMQATNLTEMCFVLLTSQRDPTPVPCSDVSSPRYVVCEQSLDIYRKVAPSSNSTCPAHLPIRWENLCLSTIKPSNTFFNAQKLCMVNNSALLTIHDVRMQRFVYSLLKNYTGAENLWLGSRLNFNKTDSTFRGIRLTYWHFSPGEPNKGMLFMRKSTGQWGSAAPKLKNVYICSAKMNFSSKKSNNRSSPSKTTTLSQIKDQSTTPLPTSSSIIPSTGVTSNHTTTIITTQPPPPPLACPTRFTLWNGICYQLFHQQALTWHNAKKACERIGSPSLGNLVSIHSIKTNKFLTEMARNTSKSLSKLWIGLTTQMSDYHDSLTRWTDETALDYINLRSTDILSGVENCISMEVLESFGVWKFTDCSTSLPYVCAYYLGEPPKHSTNSIYTPSSIAPEKDTTCWHGYKLYNNRCVKVFTDKRRTWSDANAHCKSTLPQKHQPQATLSTFDHESDNLFAYSLLESNLYDHHNRLLPTFQTDKSFWIGYQMTNGQVFRVDQGQVTYSHYNFSFRYVSPDNANSPVCATMNGDSLPHQGGHWMVSNCDELHYFICQSEVVLKSELLLGRSIYDKPKEPDCAVGFMGFPRANGISCYIELQKKYTNWDSARHDCEQHQPSNQNVFTNSPPDAASTNTHLLSLSSAYELAFLRSWIIATMTSRDVPFWLGWKVSPQHPSSFHWLYEQNASVTLSLWLLDPPQLSSTKDSCFSLILAGAQMAQSMNVTDCSNIPLGFMAVCKYDLYFKDPTDFSGQFSVTTFSSTAEKCVRWDMLSDRALRQRMEHEFDAYYRNQSILYNGLSSGADYCWPLHAAAQDQFCYIAKNGTYERQSCVAPLHNNVTTKDYFGGAGVIIFLTVVFITMAILAGFFLWKRSVNGRTIAFSRLRTTVGADSAGTAFYNPIYTPAKA